MTEEKVAKREEASPTTDAGRRELTPETDVIFVPDVDITEDGDGLRLLANMPGTDSESVDVTVENNVLTIEGRACVDRPEGYELAGQEYGVGNYRRDFSLANSVDTAGIKARVKHGVLEVTIPKREEVKTRKVEIEG